jgi:hypothetical protein
MTDRSENLIPSGIDVDARHERPAPPAMLPLAPRLTIPASSQCPPALAPPNAVGLRPFESPSMVYPRPRS